MWDWPCRFGHLLKVWGSVGADGESAESVLLRSSSVGVAVAPEPKMSGRAFRRSLKETGRYVAKPTNDPESLDAMERHGVGYSRVGLVAQMRANNNEWQYKDIRIKLAKAYGYCWGVERAVQMAYEAKRQYPDRKIHLTNEIIHNPAVNQVCSHACTGRPPAVVEELLW